MLAITLNPGFVLIVAAVLMLAAPAALRALILVAAAALAMWLVLQPEFGDYDRFAQIGLTVVPFRLDALNQVFGIAFITATIILGLYCAGRRHRLEDAAIALLSGGAVSALFVGDLISFVAAMSLAGLAAVWVVMVSLQPGAGAAASRLLIWHGLEGLLLLCGVAFHWAGASDSMLAELSTQGAGGACIFAALLIRVGAPLAHVWLKDAVGHSSGPSAVALSTFSSMLGVYALMRLFPAEAMLAPIGGAMIVLGAFFAASEDDLRRAAAYGLLAQIGLCVALIGVGSPLSLAAAAAHAFTAIFATALLLMALGVVLWKRGETLLSRCEGLAREAPASAAFATLGGFAAAGAPGFAAYISLSVALEATAQWEFRLLWTLASASAAVLVVALGLRPALTFLRAGDSRSQGGAAPFPMLLATGLAAFFCVTVGLAPGWLYRLTPASLSFDPYSLDRVAPHLELIGAAGAAYVLLRLFGLVPKRLAAHVLDLDALYRGPVAGAGRWSGVVLLRVYGAWRDLWQALSSSAVGAMGRWANAWDRPYSGHLGSAVQFAAIGAGLLIILLARL